MCAASIVISAPPFVCATHNNQAHHALQHHHASVSITPPLISQLGSSLAFMMVYVWARRNEDVRMSFLGLFTFRAPLLPGVLLGFSVLLGNSYAARMPHGPPKGASGRGADVEHSVP